MALKQPRFAKDYARNRRAVAFTAVGISQIFAAGLLAWLLFATGLYQTNPLAAVIVVVAQSAVGLILSILLYQSNAKPLQDVLAAILHISGEPSALTPPNPNTTANERSGFKDVLQTLYALASQHDTAQASLMQKMIHRKRSSILKLPSTKRTVGSSS